MKLIARHQDGSKSEWESDYTTDQYRQAMKDVVEWVYADTKAPPVIVLARIK